MNREYEKFHRDNKDIIDNLLESLEVLLGKFSQGIVPGEPEKSDALYMLDVYKDAFELINKVETPAFRRIRTEKSSFDEETTYKEFAGLKDSISLLMKLGREKIIATDDAIFQSYAGKVLLQGNYCDEVVLEGSEKHYYSLSSKAEKTLKSKNLVGKIRKEYPTAVVPKEMILDADKWSNLYVRRIEFLKQYYSEKMEEIEYILFTLDDEKEMVFGCELSDSLEVIYTFAGIFDEKIDKHIEQLKGLAGSGLIDNIIILINSNEMAEILEDEGMKHIPHISIERL